MQHFPARLALYGIYRRTCRRASADGAALAPPLLFIAVEATAWVAVTLAVAELVGSAISLVFQLVGAVCGSTVIFTLPGAIWLKLGPKGRTRVVVVRRRPLSPPLPAGGPADPQQRRAALHPRRPLSLLRCAPGRAGCCFSRAASFSWPARRSRCNRSCRNSSTPAAARPIARARRSRLRPRRCLRYSFL